jgi:hypothetical protein
MVAELKAAQLNSQHSKVGNTGQRSHAPRHLRQMRRSGQWLVRYASVIDLVAARDAWPNKM